MSKKLAPREDHVGWTGGYHVRVTNEDGYYWSWFTTNPQGGGGGSHDQARSIALSNALRLVPAGEEYTLEIGKAGVKHTLTKEVKRDPSTALR